MRKFYILTVLVVTSFTFGHAQKVSWDFLKGVEEINFVFEYKNITVNKKPEKTFVTEEVRDKNKDKKGSGDTWKTEWETTYREYWQTRFVNDFNKEIPSAPRAVQDDNAEIKAVVKTVSIVTGFAHGPIYKEAWVYVTITFYKKDSSKPLAVWTIKKAKTGWLDYGDMWVEKMRIAGAYGQASEKLGKAIVKALKIKK